MNTKFNDELFFEIGKVALIGVLLIWIVHQFALFLSRQQKKRFYHCEEPTKYPIKLPYLGMDFLKVYNQAHCGGRYFDFWQEQYGTFGQTLRVTVMGKPWLFTCAAENIRAIHATEAHNFIVEPIRRIPVAGWIGEGVFTADGDKWKISRALTKPLFSRPIVSSDLERFEVHLTNLLAHIPKDGSTVELQDLLKRLYLDVSTELLFGRSIYSQVPSKANYDVEEFEKSFEVAMNGMGNRMVAKWLSKGDNEWQKAYKRVHAIFDSEIELSLRRKDSIEDGEDLVETSFVNKIAESTQDREFIRNQVLNIFIGAKDTAAIGIADIFFHLGRHPQTWKKIKAEVSAIKDDAPITFELLKSLRYVQCVVAESLRLLSPVDRGIRHCSTDCVLPTGGGKDGKSPILVEKGTRVEVSISMLHANEDFWGPDPLVFRPERWHSSLLPKWEYVPFLGGARICPAQQMMLTQYAYVVVRFAQEFSSIENRDPVEEFVPEIIFSKQSKNGVKVALHK